MTKIFKIPFATQGDRTAVPDDVQADGSLSYTQGYGYDYERDQATDPAAKDIEREKMNSIFHDITSAVGEIQAFGMPVWAEEGKPYAIRSVVYHNKKAWQSKIENNNTEPAAGVAWTELKADVTAEDVGAYTKVEANLKFQPVGNYADKNEVNGKLAKDQNGADIPNKDTFIKNLGLPEKFQAVGYSYSKTEADNNFQPKGSYQPTGNYLNKDSKDVQVVSGEIQSRGWVGSIFDEVKLSFITGDNGLPVWGSYDGTNFHYVRHPKKSGTAALISDLPGIEQEWYDLKNERSVGVNYKNNTSKLIFLFVRLGSSQYQTTEIRVGGKMVGMWTSAGSSGTTTQGAFTAIPPGASYAVIANQGGSNVLDWTEFR